jgi:hypothetical protein
MEEHMDREVKSNDNSNQTGRTISIAIHEDEIVVEAVKAAGGMVAAFINNRTPMKVRLYRTETGCFVDIKGMMHGQRAAMLLCFAVGQVVAGEIFLSMSRNKNFSEEAGKIAAEARSSLELYWAEILRLALDLLSIGEIGFNHVATMLLRDDERESATAKPRAKK